MKIDIVKTKTSMIFRTLLLLLNIILTSLYFKGFLGYAQMFFVKISYLLKHKSILIFPDANPNSSTLNLPKLSGNMH
jgi:regulatory protein YycI of two-component signal transduction system YycFG